MQALEWLKKLDLDYREPSWEEILLGTSEFEPLTPHRNAGRHVKRNGNG